MLRRLPAAVGLRGADGVAALLGEFFGKEAMVSWVVRRSKVLLVFVFAVGGQGCTYDYARFKEEAPGSSAGTATTFGSSAVVTTSAGAGHREDTLPHLGGYGAIATELPSTQGSTGGHGMMASSETSHVEGGSTAQMPTSGGSTPAQTKSFGGSGGTTSAPTGSYGGSVNTTSAPLGGSVSTTPASVSSLGGSNGGLSSSSARGGAGGSATGGALSTPAGGKSSALGTGGTAGSSTSCAPPLVDCGGTCVNVAGDPMHCGACGRSCFQASASWAVCVDRRCSCDGGGSLCAVGQICEKKSVCVDFSK